MKSNLEKIWIYFFGTSKNARALQRDLESITGLLVARKSIDTLDTRGFEINYYVIFLN
jgi:hypothetical protein